LLLGHANYYENLIFFLCVIFIIWQYIDNLKWIQSCNIDKVIEISNGLGSSLGLWVLNVWNMQAIQSGFYSLHDKCFEIISNIFGPPTLDSLIEHKTVVKLLTVNEIRCLFISAWFLFSINQNFYMLHTNVMQFSGEILQLNAKIWLFHIFNFRSSSLEKW
jgi:hypothetical protein